MTDLGTRLYHNPRCSKSRGAFDLLKARGVEPQLVLYLETPPSTEELHALLGMLGLPPRAVLRAGEDVYAELGLDNAALDDATLVAAVVAHPRLLERPIFVHAGKAVIGRPPERVLELL